MEMIDRYLDEVCGYITNASYRRAVRRELQNYIEDSMECTGKADREEAAKLAINEMGDAQEMGSRLDSHFSVRPRIRLVWYILGIFFLYNIADVAVNGAADFFVTELIMTLFAYGASAGLFLFLKRIDLEGNYRLIKYLYFGTLFLLLAIGVFCDMRSRKESMSFCGVVLILCVTFFVYRLRKENTLGFVGAVCLFLLPVPFFLLSTAYAQLLLYLAAGVYTFVCFLGDGWKISNYTKMLGALLLAVILAVVFITSFTAIFTKWSLWTHFYLRKGVYFTSHLAQDFGEYPLAACINCYGYWTLAVYTAFMLLILRELMQMKRKVNHLLGRHILNCVILFFLIKSISVISLNLGFPFIRSFMLPFAGFGVDQAANLLLIIVAEYVYCFGGIVFGDHSFFEENKLLEVGDGRITFYFRGQ